MWFRMMITMVTIFVSVSGRVGFVHADEKEDLVRELLIEIEAVEMTKDSTDIMMQQVGQIFAGQMSQLVESYDNSETREKAVVLLRQSLERIMTEIKNQYLEQMDFQALVDEVYVPVYSKYYSEGEIQDLIDFYRSSTGKKTLDTMPAVMTETMQKSAVLIQPVIGKISTSVSQKEMERLSAELKELEA